MAMSSFNLNQYTQHELKLQIQDLRNQLDALHSEASWYKQLFEDDRDDSTSSAQLVDKLVGIIRRMKKQQYHLPNRNDIKKNIIDKQQTITVPANYDFNLDHPNIFPITSFSAKKNHVYVIQVTVNTPEQIYLSSTDSDLSHYISDTRVVISPETNGSKYIKFVGKQHEHGRYLKLEFKALANHSICVLPSNDYTLHDYQVTEYYYPYNKPDYPNDNTVPVPNVANASGSVKTNQHIINWLNKLLSDIKHDKITIPTIWHYLDQNGNISYKFTAELAQKKWSFSNALNALKSSQGMYRLGWTKDVWVQLTPSGSMVKKYRGNSKQFPYDPTKDDINAKDWIITNTRPFNPNTKPNGSDPFDDSADTNNFGFDGSNDYYTGYSYNNHAEKHKSSDSDMSAVNYDNQSDIPPYNEDYADDPSDDNSDTLDSQPHKLHYSNGDFSDE